MAGGNINFEHEGHGCDDCEVESMNAMGALITAEADSMSALRFRMRQTERAMWADKRFYKSKDVL